MTDTASPPDPTVGTRPVRASAVAVVVTIACVLPVFLVGGLAVQMREELTFSPAGLGLVVAAYFGVGALASVPTGALVERWGGAVVARAGILVSATCLLAVAVLARSYPVLLGLLAVAGTANALGQLSSNVLLARHVPIRRQGLSFGIKQAAIPVSTLLAGAAVPVFALTVGWRWAFVAAAAAVLATLPAVPAQPAQSARRSVRGAGRGTFPLVVVGIAATLAAGAAGGLGTFVVDAAVDRGLEPALAGLTLTLGSAACITARVGLGWLADRRSGGHVTVIAGMLVVGAFGLALLAMAGPGPLVVGVLLGFALGWSWPGLMNFAVVQLHPQAPGTATSITQTGVYAGAALGPLTLGPLAAAAGYPTMWLTAATAMLIAAALMLTATRLLSAHSTPAPSR
ncbi:MFS transporter [Micromonospora sp. NPDC048871]|uniref:MFS transporter n=1 Tax=unclassified Micromonospora TaxID=2617518 RepID=UPI002E0E9DF5|nr:MFS transporter [Micromonospora sp. NBC_01739]